MSKMIDLAGKVFENFKVLHRDIEKDKVKTDRYVYWVCECFCDNHTIFSAKGTDINKGKVISCGCKKKTRSTSEEKIKNILLKNNLIFKMEYSLPDCKYDENGSLFFDFAVFKDNKLLCLIEYNGKQHYLPIEYWGGKEDLEIRQKRDAIKFEYCKKNNIPLIIYSYLDKINEEQLIKDIECLKPTNLSIQQIQVMKEHEKRKKQKEGTRCALVDENESILKIFNSFHDAAREVLNIDEASCIREVCNGNKSSYRGYCFRLVDSNNNIIYPEKNNFIWNEKKNCFVSQVRRYREKVCGISVFDKNDIIYYESVMAAANDLNLSRSSLQKCLSGQQRYAQVGLRIWRKMEDNELILNNINIESIIEQYQKKYIYYENEWQLIADVARKRGLKPQTVAARIRKGKTKEEALEIERSDE